MMAQYTNPRERNDQRIELERIGQDWFTESFRNKAEELNAAGTELVAQIDKIDAFGIL